MLIVNLKEVLLRSSISAHLRDMQVHSFAAFISFLQITNISLFDDKKIVSQRKSREPLCFNLIHTNDLVIQKPCEYEVFCQSLIKHYSLPLYFLCYILGIQNSWALITDLS